MITYVTYEACAIFYFVFTVFRFTSISVKKIENRRSYTNEVITMKFRNVNRIFQVNVNNKYYFYI